MQMTFVLGVHRSGTSLLAGGLAHLGCPLGDFQNQTNVDNPKGEFEHGAIVAFNDRLLAACGASWDNWGFDATSWDWETPAMRAFRDEAAALLRECYGGAPRAAVKDPRMATLLPFWAAVLDDLGWQARHVLVIRPPAQVARSQILRAERRPHGFPVIRDTESMCALWAVAMHATLWSLGPAPVLVLRHAALYEAPDETLRACAAHLGLDPEADRIGAFVSEHLDPSLRRAGGAAEAPATGFWQGLAQTLHDDAVPDGAHALRGGDWARDTALRQAWLRAVLPGLGAVHRSLGTLRGEYEAARAPDTPPEPDAPPEPNRGRSLLDRLRGR